MIVSVSLSLPGILNRIEPGTSFGYETNGNDFGRQCRPWIYRNRTAGLYSRRVRDDFMFPHPPDEQGGKRQKSKGDDADGTGQ